MSIEIGQILERLRRTKRLTQEELAFRCGISTNHLSELERGLSFPGFKTLINLAYKLDMQPEGLMKEIQENADLRLLLHDLTDYSE